MKNSIDYVALFNLIRLILIVFGTVIPSFLIFIFLGHVPSIITLIRKGKRHSPEYKKMWRDMGKVIIYGTFAPILGVSIIWGFLMAVSVIASFIAPIKCIP